MSQIGKLPITLPENVEVTNANNNISVKGKLGDLKMNFDSSLTIDISDAAIIVSRNSNDKKDRELHGLTRSLINNMIIGVSEGYEKKMLLVGTGYTADASKGNFLLLNVGFSHPVYVQCPDSITVKTPQPTEIVITGIDKQLVGQFAARIRQIRKPEPYKGKGIRYSDEIVRKKAGKTVGAK
tara:strand:+ start:653 stop:1198 length:546 start_codon:yes stop_codon:yes gene_type:complete